MLAIGLRYLCGAVRATHPAKREEVEWPPHPDRVFMALVAAHAETDGAPTEETALKWLEQLGAPQISASTCQTREAVTAYVPVNDVVAPRPRKGKPHSVNQVKAGVGLLPEYRLRQPRCFPTAIPDDPVVYLCWADANPSPECRTSLADMCAKVTYVGHSSSLVQMWIEDQPPEPNWAPGEGPAVRWRLRVSGPGRLKSLQVCYEAGQRPTPAAWAGYAPRVSVPAAPQVASSVFDHNLIVLRSVGGRQFGMESTLQITGALRDTAMAKCPVQPPPEWISGHRPDGKPSTHPHMAIIPLANVGHDHGDGHLLGLGHGSAQLRSGRPPSGRTRRRSC